jgi:sec-independent protein translocase protein TatA
MIAAHSDRGPAGRPSATLARAVRSRMIAFLEGPELLIVLAIVVLVFGASQLPKLARSLGQAQKEFKSATSDEESPPPTK